MCVSFLCVSYAISAVPFWINTIFPKIIEGTNGGFHLKKRNPSEYDHEMPQSHVIVIWKPKFRVISPISSDSSSSYQ